MDGTHFLMGKIDEAFLIAAEAGYPTPESHLAKRNDDSFPIEQFHHKRKERPTLDERSHRLIEFFSCHGSHLLSDFGCQSPPPFYASAVGCNSRSSRLS